MEDKVLREVGSTLVILLKHGLNQGATADMGDGDPISSDFCGNVERATRGNPDPLHLRVTKFLQALLFVYAYDRVRLSAENVALIRLGACTRLLAHIEDPFVSCPARLTLRSFHTHVISFGPKIQSTIKSDIQVEPVRSAAVLTLCDVVDLETGVLAFA
ncbi:hypothetical protein BS50DRAFT_595344, partial [Corynespora cassiicola Philippines]